MVSVSCFGVRVLVMFHFMFVHYTLSSVGLLCGHLLVNSCPLGYLFVLIVFCLFVIFFFSCFGFKSGICLLIAPVPVHWFSNTSTLNKDRSLLLFIVDNTNKFIKIYRHGLLGKISVIQNNVASVNTVIRNKTYNSNLDLKDLDVPDKYRSKIEKLVLKNQDMFASKDSELGHTDIVKIQIEVENHEPIKMRPY